MADDYCGLSELFQRMALGSKAIAELTFDLEKAIYGKNANTLECGPPIFVAGMARAGTTALLRALYAQGTFATLTFRDLPWLLAPNLWNRVSDRFRHDIAAQVRGQDDGILQDLDSPEALEEGFWRVFDSKRYISNGLLRSYTPPIDTLEDYRVYVRLILLRHGGLRYLAKNNNNVLRLSGLQYAFPDALIVHPFRDPVQQIGSLMHHHAHAVETQRTNRSKLDFMDRLAHHEFGLGHLPFSFPGMPMRSCDTRDPNYWLGQWIDLHTFLIGQPTLVRRQQIFVDMDAVAGNAQAGIALISRLIGTEPKCFPGFRTAVPRVVEGLKPATLRQANDLAAEMRRLVSTSYMVTQVGK
jgi:hypothetical protein